MFKSMAEFKTKNKAEGLHFFDRDTMRFWKSRVESVLIGGRYFITSEYAMPERIYAVRETRPDGRVNTLKSHIATLEDARGWLKNYRKGLQNS